MIRSMSEFRVVPGQAAAFEKAYRDGELIAIKANYLDETRRLIASAKKARAERHAPPASR